MFNDSQFGKQLGCRTKRERYAPCFIFANWKTEAKDTSFVAPQPMSVRHSFCAISKGAEHSMRNFLLINEKLQLQA
jgi:hypothetical protein